MKVIRVENDIITFEDGTILFSSHERDCCESHHLSMRDLTLRDFEGLDFDLSKTFFEAIPGYGIALIPTTGKMASIKIPGYGSNNGYYSSNLKLTLTSGGYPMRTLEFDISNCQHIANE